MNALRELWRTHRMLMWTLGLSLLIHLSLLTLRLAAPEAYNRVFKDTPLEITLVNARSQTLPEQPQALAQAQLSGGGDGRPTIELSSSPMVAQNLESDGDAISPAEQQILSLKMQQTMLLSVLRQELTLLEQALQGAAPSDEKTRKEQRRQLLSRQLAQIEQRIQSSQSGPRKRYISPATKEVPYAVYYDRMRRAIELQGTENFPEAEGRKLYGKLIMAITVDSEGQLVSTEVLEPSHSPLLDARAVAIVRSTAPFGPFSKRMRQHSDQIVVVTRFRFARDDSLRTRMVAPEKEGAP